MSMSSVSINEVDEITGIHSGSLLPAGNIQVTNEQIETIRELQKIGMTQNSRPLWNSGSPLLPPDSRPYVEVKVNGSISDAVIFIDTPFSVSMANPNFPDGTIIVKVFGRLFAMNFIDGVATKTISNALSGEFQFGGDLNFRSNPLKLQIVE